MKEMKIPSQKVEKKVEVLKLDHMSQHYGRHMSPYCSKNKKKLMVCHHCGIQGHTRYYCFVWIKIKIVGRKEGHVKNWWKFNDSLSSSIVHTKHKVSWRK